MNKLFLILSIATILSCTDRKTKQFIPNENTANSDGLVFSDSLRALVVTKRQDSSSWDMDILKTDLSNPDLNSFGPFRFGSFPVPEYDLIGKGTFTGLGNFGYTGSGRYFKKIKDKTILYNSFFVKKSKLNAHRLGNRNDEIFFQIIVLTDSIDSVNFTHAGGQIISRNHPDNLGQGFYKTKNNRIDYIAFTTPENEAYAIVNTRLFNLNFGKTILIAPQKDGSLRSMQILSPDLSSGELEIYTDNLLKEKRVGDFFTKPGNI